MIDADATPIAEVRNDAIVPPMIRAAAIFLTLATAACVHQPSPAEPLERLPLADEVITFVSTRWTKDYRERFAKFASRPTGVWDLVSVTNVTCAYHFVTPECSFNVTAQFSGEPAVQRRMTSQFGWDALGELEEVIVMYHYRKR